MKKRNKYFEEYYQKIRNDISFITLKKNATIKFKDKEYITGKELPVPIRVEKLLEDIKKQDEIDGLTLNNLIDGIIYLMGTERSFEYIVDYKEMFKKLSFEIVPYIIYCINNSNNSKDNLVYAKALINNEDNEKSCFIYASALENMGIEFHEKGNEVSR